MPEVYVYLHSRPDGSVFYVGKGNRSRAYEMASSRRTAHYRNVISKYGRENIGIRLVWCPDDASALALEAALIADLRASGAQLVNITNGGEGASGRPVSEAQAAALARGRGKNKRVTAALLDALRLARAARAAGVKEGRYTEQFARLAAVGREVLHRERTLSCFECGVSFATRSAKAKCCSRLCEQRNRRARQASVQGTVPAGA